MALLASGSKAAPTAKDGDLAAVAAFDSPTGSAAGFASDDIVITVPTLAATPTAPPTPTPAPDPTLKRGDESEEVTKLQKRLIELGYLDIDEPTLLFGPATEEAVRYFQRQTGVQQDGIAGLDTLTRIYADDAPKYVAKAGMEGGDIEELQLQLIDLGYMKHATGYYGDETTAAIKEFQSRNGLSADGLAGEATISTLYSDGAKESSSKTKEKRRKANIDIMITTAKNQLGKKYVRGKRGPDTFDCSGFVYYCLKAAGSNRNRLTAAGYSGVSDWEKKTDINKLKKGDLIFFYDDGFTKVGHVGIILDSTYMIDASSGNGKVVKRTYKSSYWEKHFVCARTPW